MAISRRAWLLGVREEEIPYELNGRYLVLYHEDTRMTFARGSAPVPPAAVTPEPSQQPGPPDIPDLSGYYELTAYVQDGESITDGETGWLYLDETGGGWLQLDGETHEVVITLEAKGTSAISTVSADGNDSKNAIYDLQGRKAGLPDEWESLPSGVYIKNGRKVIR